MSLFLYASEDIHPSNKYTAPSAVEALQLQEISQVRLNVLLFLLRKCWIHFRKTVRESQLIGKKILKVLNATSLTCVLYLRNFILSVAGHQSTTTRLRGYKSSVVPPLEDFVRFPAPR